MLPGQVYRELNEALLDAYDLASFTIMLRAELSKKLSQYAPEQLPFPDIVASVIAAAEREGWIEALVFGAAQHNPGNRRLARLAEIWNPEWIDTTPTAPVTHLPTEQGGSVSVGGDSNAPIIAGDISDSVVNLYGNYTAWPMWLRAVLATLLVMAVLTLVLVLRNQPSNGPSAEPTTQDPAAVCVAGVAPSSAELGQMIPIPGAAFIMGDNINDRPQHEVIVESFLIDRFEVTNQQYQRYILETDAAPPQGWDKSDFPVGQSAFQPVTNVTWQQAADYCAAQNKRLPSEAEWEYACRGPEGNTFPWGAEIEPQLANTLENACGQTQTVGSYSPGGDGAFGVADLVGNAAEWVNDLYRAYPYITEQDDTQHATAADLRSVRGASWATEAWQGNCTVRAKFPAEAWFEDIGFRCASDTVLDNNP